MMENQRTTCEQKVISIYQDLLYPLIVNFDKFCQHRSVCDADEKYNIISSWGGGGEYRLHSKKCKKSNLELCIRFNDEEKIGRKRRTFVKKNT